jgi:hypothetical protein
LKVTAATGEAKAFLARRPVVLDERRCRTIAEVSRDDV